MALVACPDCGHDVSTEAPVCPNCGRPWPGRQVVAPVLPRAPRPPTYNGFAITSFVLGLAGLLCLQPLGIGAVSLGPMALSQLNRQRAQGGREQQGRALAIAGIVTGAIAIVLTVALVVFLASADWEVTYEDQGFFPPTRYPDVGPGGTTPKKILAPSRPKRLIHAAVWWGSNDSQPAWPAISPWRTGCLGSVRSSRSGSRAPGRMVLASAAVSALRGSWLWR